MELSLLRKTKPLIKGFLPDPVWQRVRWATKYNWVFGWLFTLFVGKYRTKGLVFEIPKELFPIPNRASFLFDIYEDAERRKAEDYIEPGDSVVELGAGIGVISCTTNRMLADKTKHVVIEPHPLAIPYLHRNRLLNRAEFTVINAVISPRKIEAVIFGDNLHNSRFGEREQTRRLAGVINGEIAGITLDELNKQYGPFNVLIMDIEGVERFVVEANADTISKFRMILLEFHPSIIGEDECDRIRKKFLAMGFERLGEESCVEAWRKK